MLTKHTAYKYEIPYTGPFVMTRCWTNVTFSLKIGAREIRYNIRRIKPYASDTKVEDSIIYMTKSTYDPQLYTSV